MVYYVLDDEKNLVETTDVLEWTRWFEKVGFMGRRVQETKLPNGLRISTVFLGVDYNFWDGAPLVFETMVFPPGSWRDLDMKRYGSWTAAFEGHNAMVAKWMARTEYLRGGLITEVDVLGFELDLDELPAE